MGMMKTFGYVIVLAGQLSTGTMALAQDVNRVATKIDWGVFVADNPTECWVATSSREAITSLDVRLDAVNPGQPVLMAFYRPAEGGEGHVAFTAGYPFARGSTVSMAVPGFSFELLTDGEWAWPATNEDDSKVIRAMILGTRAVLSGRSAQGIVTKDTFSLWGFTAAFADAAKRCGF